MSTTAKERMQAALADPDYLFTGAQVQWLISQAVQDAEERTRRMYAPPSTVSQWQMQMRQPRANDFMGGPVPTW